MIEPDRILLQSGAQSIPVMRDWDRLAVCFPGNRYLAIIPVGLADLIRARKVSEFLWGVPAVSALSVDGTRIELFPPPSREMALMVLPE